MQYRTSIAILIAIILAQAAWGIGVSPPTIEEYFEPGLSKYINLKILNSDSEHVTITAYAKGDLEQYISFPSGIIQISPHEKDKIFPYRIELPEKLDKKGTLTTNIIILAIPEQTAGDTIITTNTEIVSVLKVIVPINKKYVEANIYIPSMERGKEANIVVEVRNLGTERIEEVIGVIDIVNSLGEKAAILKSEVVTLQPKEKKTIVVPWTPQVRNGIYEAKLTLIYDGLNSMDTKKFTIGTPTITITDISVDSFRLGGIAKFDILLESEWNQKIQKAYAVVNVLGKDGKVYTTFKTVDTDIDPFGKQVLQAYWDTDKVVAGEYFLEITLHYLNSKTQDTRLITVNVDNIGVSTVGLAIQGGTEGSGEISMNMMFITVILLLVIIIIVILFRRKK